MTLKEPHRHKKIIKKGYVLDLLKTLQAYFVGNKALRHIMLFSALIFSLNQAVLWFYQPYFRDVGIDLAYFGLIFASFHLVAGLSSKYSHAIEEKIGMRYSFTLLVSVLGASQLLMGIVAAWFCFAFAFMQQFVRGFLKVVSTDYINKIVSSDVRATVLSAQNLLSKLMYACIIPFIGWFADVYTITHALSMLGLTTVILGSFFLLLMKKAKTF